MDRFHFVEHVPAMPLLHIAVPAVAMSRLRLGSDGSGESGDVHDGDGGGVLFVPSMSVVGIVRCKIGVLNHLARPNLLEQQGCPPIQATGSGLWEMFLGAASCQVMTMSTAMA